VITLNNAVLFTPNIQVRLFFTPSSCSLSRRGEREREGEGGRGREREREREREEGDIYFYFPFLLMLFYSWKDLYCSHILALQRYVPI
jgi:hypothetical protein